ncbi:hypothetical protein [Streptomyces cahuitamycinicus]|uniref:Uncharacterized protein n=1 Tax=Streptomyces cahuitamycinicus TaxID=2070367 RepID=A0A2N8TDA6_9ACTN|nr:hypothetical protein [Streptomyces cahuitamycinicus]PNG17013.1 hypothetical protein C1J00_38815 [Streptomyces cahuitamycinicus]
MPLPSWLQSHLPAPESPRWTFESFTDEVARLLGLPPARPWETWERNYDTDRLWMTWKANRSGASLCLDRPHAELREYMVISVEWHQSPAPADVAAMVRAYERRSRVQSLRSLLARVLRRG